VIWLLISSVRPQYTLFPHDPKGFSIDEQYYIGESGLLIRPVTQKGVTETKVYLAEDKVRSRRLKIAPF
jgi:alpha 1,3-glucosidase